MVRTPWAGLHERSKLISASNTLFNSKYVLEFLGISIYWCGRMRVLRKINIHAKERLHFGERKFSDLIFKSNSSNFCTIWGKAKPFSDIPGPLRIPLWGNLYQYKLGYYKVIQYHKVLEDLHKKYGPLVREDLGSSTVLHVFDPAGIKTVYANEGQLPYVAPLQETIQFYRQQREMSLGLGNMNGYEWFKLRTAVRQMMLQPKEVHYYLPFVNDVAADFVQRIKDKRNTEGIVENLHDEVGKWALESAGMICFETRLGCFAGGQSELSASQLIAANKTIFELSGLLKFSIPVYKYISTPKWIKLIKAEDFFYRSALGYINTTMDKLKNPENFGKYNFITYLMSRKELNLKDVTIITLSLFADGLSTTVPALLFIFYCIATNPEVQKKLCEEINSVMGSGQQVTAESLNNLMYLKAVLKETLRLYPIGTEVSRIIQKDLVLCGYQVPSGTNVHLNANVNFLSDEFFEKPHDFRPERWLRTEETRKILPHLLTPFGHGTRTCAGRRFAEQDLYVVLCQILREFHLLYRGKEPLQQVYYTLLFPDGPLKVQFIPRK